MKIGINCGHTLSGTPGCGAVKYLNESNETRLVGYSLMKMLRAQGHTVIDCTNDRAASVNDNLRNICNLENAQPLDMFLSIHFNAGGGQGVECWTYGGADVCHASEIKHNIALLGFKNRGIKDGSNLYVIKHTNAPAVLIEVCFVDTRTDAERYGMVGSEQIAAAICEAITGTAPKNEGEDLMSKEYDELNGRVYKIENPMIYNYIDENMPSDARPTIQKLVDRGALRGNERGELGLTEDMLRVLVINDRAGAYDK